jgi:hypothetical protein
MYLVRFIQGNGDEADEAKFGSLNAAMRAINNWFTKTYGKGTIEMSYEE